jgi:hypothetical protein
MNAQEQAMKLARGVFQRDLVRGLETLGGSTLRGKAKSYSGRYQASARNLVARIKAADIPYEIELGPKGGWYSATLKFE